MLITLITPSYFPDVGGVETILKEITKRLVIDKINHAIICSSSTNNKNQVEISNSNQIIYRFKKIAPNNSYHFSLKMIPFLKIYSKRFDTLFHIHSYHALTSLNARFIQNNPYIISTYFHGGGHTFLSNLLHKPYKLLSLKVLENAEKIIVISNTEKKNIFRSFPKIDKEKIQLIPLGINKKRFSKIRLTDSDTFNIVYVGRVEKYKGIQFMMNAIKKLNIKKLKLFIIGNGSYIKELMKLVFQLDIQDQIIVDQSSVGNDILKYYQISDVFFSFSLKETYGITIAEALVCGIPCLVPNSGALSEFIDNFLCYGIKNLNDTSEIIEKINFLVNNNFKRKKYSKSIFDWLDHYKELKELYVSLS